ncbi:MAG: aldehyde dehydrogenase family protein [Candidatus Limnocylindrales bacterium]
MAGWKIGPALAAGNTVVLKPSIRTPLTALVPGRDRGGHPAARASLNVITGTWRRDRRPAGRAIPRSAWSRSRATRTPASTSPRIAADKVKRLHLELGGKAPVIVFDDADLDAVAEAIKPWGYWNAGQDCTAATRVIAGPKIYDRFVSEARRARSGRSSGATRPKADDIEMGSLIARAQADKVEGMVDRARDRRGDRDRRRPTGSTRRVLRADPHRRPGPEVGDRPGRGVRAGRHGPALQRRGPGDQAGPTTCGSGSPRPSGPPTPAAAMRVAKAIQFGTVWINDHFMLVSEMPHGGFKESGYGKDQSDVRGRGLHGRQARDAQDLTEHEPDPGRGGGAAAWRDRALVAA